MRGMAECEGDRLLWAPGKAQTTSFSSVPGVRQIDKGMGGSEEKV